MQATLNITETGSMGDGVSQMEGAPVFIPFTCKGDVARVALHPGKQGSWQGTLLEVVKESPLRQPAPCAHFTDCGGCTLQHLVPEEYRRLKEERFLQMLRRLGTSEKIALPMFSVGAASRRRVELKTTLQKKIPYVGFFAAGSHRVVPLTMCPVTEDAIVALFPALSALIGGLKKAVWVKSIHITHVEGQMDAQIQLQHSLPPADMARLKAFAENHAAMRLRVVKAAESHSTSPTPLATYGISEITMAMGDVTVSLPSGAFLQATALSHQKMVEFVLQDLAGYRYIADLYAGCGTYSFPLVASGTRVSAYEGAEEMVMAMYNATRKHALEGQVSATIRNLVAQPLSAQELSAFDAVVINPPRNGAEPQVKTIAKSQIQKLVMVSCNPATFERDAKHLLSQGYRITRALPIDQFYWNHHLEVLAAFEKERA